MRKILLALPLFLVVGLLFVELPVGNSSPNNVSPTTSTPQASSQATPAADPILSAPSTPQNIGPSKPTKSKIDIGSGKRPSYSNENDDDDHGEDHNDDHEGFEDDD